MNRKDLKDITRHSLTLYINVYILKKYINLFSEKGNFSRIPICIYVNTLWGPRKKKTILTQ
jgi:hypothetical protein